MTRLNHVYPLSVDRDIEAGDRAYCGHRFQPSPEPVGPMCPECAEHTYDTDVPASSRSEKPS